ncbi:TetR/AcrR family transcriptional regulator [Nocardia xishanensis]
MAHPRPVQARGLITQQRILQAAVQALVEHGYSGASTLRIQQIAGVSRGSLLHLFPSKDALLVAAVQHLASARFDALGADIDWPSDPAERASAVVEVMWSTYQQDYFWAATELWIAARHNAELREALAREERLLYRKLRAKTDSMFGHPINQHPDYPRVRELLNTSMRGAALTYAFDRRTPTRDSHLPKWKSVAAALAASAQ